MTISAFILRRATPRGRTGQEILAVLEATNTLKEGPEYELYQRIEATPEAFDRIVMKQIEGIEHEVAVLNAEAEKLKREIEELSGEEVPE